MSNITDELSIEANSVDPEQTAPIGACWEHAPIGAVWSGPTMFAGPLVEPFKPLEIFNLVAIF